MENKYLKSEWERLENELETNIAKNKTINISEFFMQNKISEEDLFFAPSDFSEAVVMMYCFREEYQEAIDYINRITRYDGGHTRFLIHIKRFEYNENTKLVNRCMKFAESDALKQLDDNLKIKSRRMLYDESPEAFASYPFIFLEEVILARANVKCFFSNVRLTKGESVYKANFFYNGKDNCIYFKKDFSSFPYVNELESNVKKYQTNSYQLKDFMQANYHNRFINELIVKDQVSTKTILDVVVNAYVAPSPCEWVDPYKWKRSEELSQSLRLVGEDHATENLRLLWVLLKCGFEKELIDAISDYPLFYALTLLLFDYPEFKEKVFQRIGIQGLEKAYQLVWKKSLTSKDILALAEFGKNNPDFLKALALSMHRFEYHLYIMFDYTPEFGNLQWVNMRGLRCGHFNYFFVYSPHELPILAESLSRKKLPGGISLGCFPAYYNVIHIYAVILYYLALTKNNDFKSFRDASNVLPYIWNNEKKLERLREDTTKLYKKN